MYKVARYVTISLNFSVELASPSLSSLHCLWESSARFPPVKAAAAAAETEAVISFANTGREVQAGRRYIAVRAQSHQPPAPRSHPN